MDSLGTLDDLPRRYLDALTNLNLVPLWPSLRALLPPGRPARKTSPTLWRYRDIRPLLLEAGELTPIEKAERRVLILANPGLSLEALRATPTLYIGMQLILPGETAPNHRHTPSAVRFVTEGEGAFTLVDGDKCPMEKGDLILTPAGLWHEHGHHGEGPVVWLDALDLPLIYDIEASYHEQGPPQAQPNVSDASQRLYRRSGVLPYEALDRPRRRYPLLRWPWAEVRATLEAMATGLPAGEEVRVAYVNPETGEECLPTMGFSALMLRPGETLNPPRRSCSMVAHVISGAGTAQVDGGDLMTFGESDTIAVPTHAEITLENPSTKEPAFLFLIDDAPLQRKLGIFETFARD